MINQNTVFVDAAITTALAMLVGFLFFYFFCLKTYRSGSRGAAAKIRLLLGAASAFFIFQGTVLILNEFFHAQSVGIRVSEDKIYRGLLVSVPMVLILTIISWLVGFFGNSGNEISQTSHILSSSPKPSVEQQLRRTDFIFYAFITCILGLPLLVTYWDELSNGTLLVQRDVDPARSISTPSPTPNRSLPSTTKNNATTNFSSQVCMFIWVADKGEFIKIDSAVEDKNSYTNSLIPKISSVVYVDDLMRQLRAADAANNDSLAREIAKEVRRNSMTIYYDKNFSRELIMSLAKSRDLQSKC